MIKTIKLDNNRLKYTNEKLDINFLKIDKIKIKKQGFPNYLMNQYILNYSKDKYIFIF